MELHILCATHIVSTFTLSCICLPALSHFVFADQFIACGKPRDRASELASQIWLAVIDNLEENEKTFVLLKRLAMEANVSNIILLTLMPSSHNPEGQYTLCGQCPLSVVAARVTIGNPSPRALQIVID